MAGWSCMEAWNHNESYLKNFEDGYLGVIEVPNEGRADVSFRDDDASH